MSCLPFTALVTAAMLAGAPPAAANEAPSAVRQCQTEVHAACSGQEDSDCVETGYRACLLLHGDPARARNLSGSNLRAQIFAIDVPPAGVTVERAEEEASSIFIRKGRTD